MTVAKIVLFHFVTKSLEDFALKQQRGGGLNHNGKPQTFFDHYARCASVTLMVHAEVYYALVRCAHVDNTFDN